MARPTRDPRIPAHANLDDPDEAAWWYRWAAVGDAKVAAAEAQTAWAEAADDYRACRMHHQVMTGEKIVGPGCACPNNEHLTAIDALNSARLAAREAITVAEQEFKAG